MFSRSLRPAAFALGDNILTLTATTAAAIVRDVSSRRGRELADAGRTGDEDAVLAAVTGTLADLDAAKAALAATRETLAEIRTAIAALETGTLPAVGALPDVVACAADANGIVERIAEAHPDAALITLRRDALDALKAAEAALDEGRGTAEARYERAKELRGLAAKTAFAHADLQRALTLGLKRYLADDSRWSAVLADIGNFASAEIQQRLRNLRSREIAAQREAKAAAERTLTQAQLRDDLRHIHEGSE